MSYLSEFFLLASIAFLGALSPGPDFVVVTMNSIKYGKKAGFYTAFGVALGCIIHISYCVLGIGYVVQQSILLFNIIKYLGALYLIYLGLKALFSRYKPQDLQIAQDSSCQLTNTLAIKKGFLVNALNPKATLFFLSVFTQVINPKTPLLIQVGFGIEMITIAFLWFCTLTWILTNHKFNEHIKASQTFIDKLLGGVLVALGLKVASISQ